jgi:hypothetical protein
MPGPHAGARPRLSPIRPTVSQNKWGGGGCFNERCPSGGGGGTVALGRLRKSGAAVDTLRNSAPDTAPDLARTSRQWRPTSVNWTDRSRPGGTD